jgi:hypothetical protein
MDFTNPVKELVILIKLVWLRKVQEWLVLLVLPKTLMCVEKCQMWTYSSLLRTFYLYRILNSDADISRNYINKAFEVEILQNK